MREAQRIWSDEQVSQSFFSTFLFSKFHCRVSYAGLYGKLWLQCGRCKCLKVIYSFFFCFNFQNVCIIQCLRCKQSHSEWFDVKWHFSEKQPGGRNVYKNTNIAIFLLCKNTSKPTQVF